jgi:hypothetical protein
MLGWYEYCCCVVFVVSQVILQDSQGAPTLHCVIQCWCFFVHHVCHGVFNHCWFVSVSVSSTHTNAFHLPNGIQNVFGRIPDGFIGFVVI